MKTLVDQGVVVKYLLLSYLVFDKVLGGERSSVGKGNTGAEEITTCFYYLNQGFVNLQS